MERRAFLKSLAGLPLFSTSLPGVLSASLGESTPLGLIQGIITAANNINSIAGDSFAGLSKTIVEQAFDGKTAVSTSQTAEMLQKYFAGAVTEVNKLAAARNLLEKQPGFTDVFRSYHAANLGFLDLMDALCGKRFESADKENRNYYIQFIKELRKQAIKGQAITTDLEMLTDIFDEDDYGYNIFDQLDNADPDDSKWHDAKRLDDQRSKSNEIYAQAAEKLGVRGEVDWFLKLSQVKVEFPFDEFSIEEGPIDANLKNSLLANLRYHTEKALTGILRADSTLSSQEKSKAIRDFRANADTTLREQVPELSRERTEQEIAKVRNADQAKPKDKSIQAIVKKPAPITEEDRTYWQRVVHEGWDPEEADRQRGWQSQN